MLRYAIAFALVGGLLTGTASAQTVAPAKPSILYVQGLQCPAHKTCTNNSAYFDRIREIPKVGFPSKALSNGSFSDSEPAWSPDHTKIAFVRESHNGLSYTIWVMNAAGTGAKALTHGNRVDAEPSWAPDGKTIVFRGNSPNGRTFDFYTVGASGSGLKRITSNPDNVSVINPDWSPNGKLIVFQRTKQNAGAGTGIFTITPTGSGLKRLTIGGQEPVWSPNGKKIAFVGPDSSSGGQFQIYVMSSAGTGKTKVTHGAESTEPAWSSDGSQLVFVRGSQITLVNANGTGVKQLTKALHGLAFVDKPDW